MSRDWTQEELQIASKTMKATGHLSYEEKTISITEKVIGDTLYIIESAVSSTAKETAYDKLKRMILNDTESLEIKKAS